MGRIVQIDHVGIAVKNLDEALKLFTEVFGLKVRDISVYEADKVRSAFVEVGESAFEVSESTDPEGPIAKFVEKRGEGIHHVSLRVENIEEVIEELKAKGVQMIDEKPRSYGNIKIAFVHPKSTRGILVELCERL